MWHIRDIKQRAHYYMHTAYWRSVVAALVLGIVTSSIAWILVEFGLSVMTSTAQIDFGAVYYEMNMSGLVISPTLLSTTLTIIFLIGLILAIIGLCIDLFLMKPVNVGCRRYYVVNHAMPGRSRASELFHAFSDHYLNVVWTMLLRSVYTILWSLLLVLPCWAVLTFVFHCEPVMYLLLLPLVFPGIIKHYAYRLVPYILAEEPGMDFDDVITLSRRMMRGNKWHAFLLDFSFLGWRVLNVFTLGILGVFYIAPYRQTANTEMYITIRDAYLGRQ